MNKLDARPVVIRVELAELETFLAVVREGSFSVAANQLNVSQPSVTNRIKRLEETLRVKLLTRTTRRVQPTAEGTYLQGAATTALRDLREVVRHFQALSELDRNRVVVAATPMIAATVMPQLIHSYRQRFGDVTVQLKDLPYDQVVAAIANGEAEIGVTALDTVQKNLRFELLAEEPMVLVVPSRHPLTAVEEVTLRSLAPYPLIVLGRYAGLRRRLEQEYARMGVAFQPGTAATLPTLLGMIDAGNCITFLPRSMAQAHAKRTRTTLTVQGFRASRRYGTVVARKASLSAATQSFLAHLRAEFQPRLLANLDG